MNDDFTKRLAIIKTLLFFRPIVRFICKPLLILFGIGVAAWIFNIAKFRAGEIIPILIVFVVLASTLLGYDTLIFKLAKDDIDVRL